jgi:epoxyqueuosine reductase
MKKTPLVVTPDHRHASRRIIVAALTERIKQFALNQGYAKVGITPAENFTEWIEEIQTRGEDKYSFLIKNNPGILERALIKKRHPEAKSIIVMVWDYAQHAFPDALLGKIGRIYLARCYDAPPDHINGARLELVKHFLVENGCTIISDVFIPKRLAGTKAGVVNYGRNSFVYANGIGSFILLAALVVDKELDYDVPNTRCICPPGCVCCREACPTGAIYEPFRIDPKRCLACNAFFSTRERAGMSDYMPENIRERLGSQIHGCDICQEACPRNQPRLKAKLPKDTFLENLSSRFSLVKTLHMEGDYYEMCIQPVAYNYITDPVYFQRNAAVAIGNSHKPEDVFELEKALRHEIAFVRGHVAWALGKIGGAMALAVLQRQAKRENDPTARLEVESAIQRIQIGQQQVSERHERAD